MSVKKCTYASGRVTWSYCFDAPGSTKANRKQIREYGFATKQEAVDAEAKRRISEQEKYTLSKVLPVESVPKTLGNLLEAFLKEHAEKNLSSSTTERYRECLEYLSPELKALPIAEVKPFRLNQEWNRLKESGGRDRRTKQPRPLGPGTIRYVARFVSSAFARGKKWGLCDSNPVTNSEPPKKPKTLAIALTPAQQELLLESATGTWMRTFLVVDAATGCRRGELLALRWSDIVDGRLIICRSLCQTKEKGLEFKTTKTARPRVVGLPAPAIKALATYRQQQDEFRTQFGPDYRHDLDLVFANPDGSPLKPDSVSSAVAELFKRLKIPKPKGASLHLLRHTHTSHLLASGVPLPAVSARLGHSSIRTTQEIYAHMITGQDDEAVRAWEEFQKKAAGQKLPREKRDIV